jgi:hypothetical protein
MGTALIPFEPGSRPPASADTRAKPTGFDCSELKPDVADELQQSAERIRDWVQSLQQSIIKIGYELIERKKKVPRGKWLAWLATEFTWDARTAQRLMRVAKTLGEKADLFRNLEATALYKLSETPKKTLDNIMARLERGEKFTLQMIAETREADVKKAARQKEARAIVASAAVEECVVERKVDEIPETPATQQGRPDQARAVAESSAVEERVAERKVDEVAAAPHARQSRPDPDRQADAVASAWRAADLILDQLRQDREELAFLLELADEHELVEHLRQGLATRSRQAA